MEGGQIRPNCDLVADNEVFGVRNLAYNGGQFVSGRHRPFREGGLTIFDSQERYNLIGDNDDWYHCQRKSVRDKGEALREIGKEFLPLEKIEIEHVEEYRDK